MPGYVDSHVHAYPLEVIRDPCAWALSRSEKFWGTHTAPGKIQGWADADRMLRDMDAAGVEVAVLQGWYWENESTCAEENAWHAAWVAGHPDRFVSLASVQPLAGKSAVDNVKRALDMGFRGVGELHPWVQGWSLDSDVWGAIADLCRSYDVPVCFHVTEPVGRNYVGRTATPLESYASLAERMPDLKIVLAHWGGGMPFFHLNKYSRKVLTNVYYDTAASPLVYTRDVWQRVTELAGLEHVLYGSDYPLIVYPSKQSEPDFTMLIEEAKAQLPADAFDPVMSGNARRVYGIPAR